MRRSKKRVEAASELLTAVMIVMMTTMMIMKVTVGMGWRWIMTPTLRKVCWKYADVAFISGFMYYSDNLRVTSIASTVADNDIIAHNAEAEKKATESAGDEEEGDLFAPDEEPKDD